MPLTWAGSYGVRIPCPSAKYDFYGIRTLTLKIYAIQTPTARPYELILLGMGVVFNTSRFATRIAKRNPRQIWETDFYPVRVLGGTCARPMRLPDPSPVLDKSHAPMGPEILFSAGAGVWRKAPKAFPHSSSVLDKFQSAKIARFGALSPSST